MSHSTWKMDYLLTVVILLPLTLGFNSKVKLKGEAQWHWKEIVQNAMVKEYGRGDKETLI